MNALQKTLAIIALLALVSQTVRHGYRLWLEPRGSVLDKYDQPLKGQIDSAASLDELLARYDKVHKEADAKRQERLNVPEKDRPYLNESQTEPYKSEGALREAITDWEKKSAEIRELKFYWAFGFVFLVLGALIYRKFSPWLGLTLLIVAFSEFIYWTSPSFLGSGIREYDRLLINKLTFSVISLVLLLALIRMTRIFGEKEPSKS